MPSKAPTPSPLPAAATAAPTVPGDVRAAITHHIGTQYTNGTPTQGSGGHERVVSPASVYSPTAIAAAMLPSTPIPAFPVSASTHMNAAVLHDVSYPTPRAAAIAREAVEAAQLYYNLFFQAGEEPAHVDAPAGDSVDPNAVAAATAAATTARGDIIDHAPQQQQQHAHVHADPRACRGPTAVMGEGGSEERGRPPAHHRLSPPPPPAAATMTVSVAADAAGGDGDAVQEDTRASAAVTPPGSSSQDPLLIQHSDASEAGGGSRASSRTSSSTSTSSERRRRGGHAAESHDALTATCSSAVYATTARTPVNVVNTAYHTFFPPVLSRRTRDAIVRRIVKHRPRPYHAWRWRKAEDYHALHAMNVHHNNVYQQQQQQQRQQQQQQQHQPPMGVTAAALSNAPSQLPTTPAGYRTTTVAEPTPSTAVDDGATGPGDIRGGAERLLPHSASFSTNEMPFELMSQLSMYTIPTSQQGPEYFKAAAQDGTKTLVIFMMGLPARGKTFLAQKICRLLGWHGSRAKVQNIQVAWRRVLLDWEATHLDAASFTANEVAVSAAEAAATAAAAAAAGKEREAGAAGAADAGSDGAAAAANVPIAASALPVRSAFTRLGRLADSHSTQDDVTRVVRDLATESLTASPRRGTGAASTSTFTRSNTTTASPTAAAANQSTTSSCYLSATTTGGVVGPLSSTNASSMFLDRHASPVCPSMLPYTIASVEGSPVTSALPASVTMPAVAAAAAAASTAPAGTTVAAADGLRDTGRHHSPTTTATGADAMSDGGAPSLQASAGTARQARDGADVHGADEDDAPLPAEVLCTRHFRDLIESPTSVARRLYRYVLQSFADDCRLFFQHGGEVVVVNDDFVTEELRQEAERLFRPLAAQFFYMEVIRDPTADPLDLVQCKIRDPMEYPRSDIDPVSAADDFHERLAFLERAYETLQEAPATTTMTATPTAPRLQRSYVKIMNSNTIETHGISGYLASRVISYVMNLSQMKIQHPIYFVRHGESCYNLEDRIGGNPLLTEQGMRDAGALLEFLGSLKHHLERVDSAQYKGDQQERRPPPLGMDGGAGATSTTAAAAAASSSLGSANAANSLEMWTSQLRRAIQTAELSERLLNIRTLRWSSLNEIHAGVCEDMTYAEVKERYPLIDHFRKRSKYTFRYPEGESYQDLVVRLEPVIMELENADKVVVVVAHQAVLRCLLAYFGSTSAESSISVEVPHRTVWRCTYDSKGIASLDELKLDNIEAGFHLPQRTESPTAADGVGH
ncbi:6-phosphofructo-2-kinase/fructose-2,6-biphosphatase [Novymonas esmeraldas]|uniref:6-phosphofructo-2-kinase/fructose-2, 6-biphosphatase n=1 Tax=Novymonas esmeraldas TaxID=1808958 RepID=A0AAW0F665_9TRYP